MSKPVTLVSEFAFAPFASSSDTTSTWLFSAALCNGVCRLCGDKRKIVHRKRRLLPPCPWRSFDLGVHLIFAVDLSPSRNQRACNCFVALDRCNVQGELAVLPATREEGNVCKNESLVTHRKKMGAQSCGGVSSHDAAREGRIGCEGKLHADGWGART